MVPASVLLPLFRVPSDLPLVLAAWGRQTVPDLEVLLVVRDEDEHLARLARRAAVAVGEAGPRLHLLRLHGARPGPVPLLDAGLARSTGTYVFIGDVDGVPAPDLLEVHLEAWSPSRLLIGGCVDVPEAARAATAAPHAVPDTDLDAAHHARLDALRHDLLDAPTRRRLYRDHVNAVWQALIGCAADIRHPGLNLGAGRAELLAVGGFEVGFPGWRAAEIDLRARLAAHGVLPKSVWPGAHVFRLPAAPVPRVDELQRERAREALVEAFGRRRGRAAAWAGA